MALLMVSAHLACAGEKKDVWYDAKGNVVMVTRAVQEKPRWVPMWQKREAARAARRGRVQRTRSSYWYPYDGYGYGYGCGWSFRPACYGYHHHHHHAGHPCFYFQGTYYGSGWSVQVGY